MASHFQQPPRAPQGIRAVSPYRPDERPGRATRRRLATGGVESRRTKPNSEERWPSLPEDLLARFHAHLALPLGVLLGGSRMRGGWPSRTPTMLGPWSFAPNVFNLLKRLQELQPASRAKLGPSLDSEVRLLLQTWSMHVSGNHVDCSWLFRIGCAWSELLPFPIPQVGRLLAQA